MMNQMILAEHRTNFDDRYLSVTEVRRGCVVLHLCTVHLSLQARHGLSEGILEDFPPHGGSENSSDQIYCMLLWSRRKK